MILIADSGSTKTDWSLITPNEIKRFQTIGLNPYHINTDEIISELQLNLVPNIDNQAIKKTFFYGAGCSLDSKKDTIYNALNQIFPNTTISIWHDLLAACRGLHPEGNGMTGILGTGSNVCIYEKGRITKGINSLGYILGDEGGGVYMGKLCIKSWLQNKMPSELAQDFSESYQLQTADILDSIYKKAQPNRYLAQFSKFLKKHEKHPFSQKLIMQNFDDWFENQVKSLENYECHSLSCIGSIAENFKPQLIESANKHGIVINTIEKGPMDGLIQYHLQTS